MNDFLLCQEIQVVDEIFDKHAASRMGVDRVGQVCIMIHSGSRGLGHQVVCFFYILCCRCKLDSFARRRMR